VTTPDRKQEAIQRDAIDSWLNLPHEERRNVLDRLAVEAMTAGPQTGIKYSVAREVLEAMGL
jgi:predicted Fe-S protein YdhL (DUF1289 family)